MGAIFNQKLVRATLEDFGTWKDAFGCKVVGTSGSAETDYQDVIYPEKLVLMMGSERRGLQLEHRSLCDLIVRIPWLGGAIRSIYRLQQQLFYMRYLINTGDRGKNDRCYSW